MKNLLIAFLFIASFSVLGTSSSNVTEFISVEVENYDPCGCDADLQECIQTNPPGSGCIQEYVQCSIACGC